jgi:hypothetical protein
LVRIEFCDHRRRIIDHCCGYDDHFVDHDDGYDLDHHCDDCACDYVGVDVDHARFGIGIAGGVPRWAVSDLW